MSVSLRAYVALVFALLMTMLIVLLGTMIYHQSSEKVKEEAGNSLSISADQMTDTLDQFMWARYQEIQVLSQLEVVKENDEAEQKLILDELNRTIPSFSWVGITDASGMVRAATGDILKGKSIKERPVFLEAKEQPFIGDVHEAVLLAKVLPNPSGEPLQFVDISVPVTKNSGQFKGVLAAHLSWKWSEEVRASVLKSHKKEKNEEVFIISKKDQTVLLGPDSMVGKPLQLKSIDEARQHKSGWTVEKWPDGKNYVTGYAFGDGYRNYKGLEWTVLVRQPESDAFKAANDLRKFVLVLGMTSTILFAFLGWLLARKIANPLKRIGNAAEDVKLGKDSKIPYIKGITDIERLSLSLQEMVATITHTKTELGEMSNLAHRDYLTGIPNRISLYAYIDQLILEQLAAASNQSFAVLFFDLDGFKPVNDQYGHQEGDRVLKEVARRLNSQLHEDEFAARLGGDEFVMVLASSGKGSKEAAIHRAKELIQLIKEPIPIQGNEVKVGCSIGGAIWPENGTSADEILHHADQALYDSKLGGKGRVTFYGE